MIINSKIYPLTTANMNKSGRLIMENGTLNELFFTGFTTLMEISRPCQHMHFFLGASAVIKEEEYIIFKYLRGR